MKYWGQAVCDRHKERINMIVSNPSVTCLYLKDNDVEIQEFIQKHLGCELRLIFRDDQLDSVAQYKKIRGNNEYKTMSD